MTTSIKLPLVVDGVFSNAAIDNIEQARANNKAATIHCTFSNTMICDYVLDNSFMKLVSFEWKKNHKWKYDKLDFPWFASELNINSKYTDLTDAMMEFMTRMKTCLYKFNSRVCEKELIDNDCVNYVIKFEGSNGKKKTNGEFTWYQEKMNDEIMYFTLSEIK